MFVYIYIHEDADETSDIVGVYESYSLAEEAVKKQLDAYLKEGFDIIHSEPGWYELRGGIALAIIRHPLITEKRIA